MKLNAARMAGTAGAALLLTTVYFHTAGLPLATKAAGEVSSSFLSALMQPLWLLPTNHWAILALVGGAMAWRQQTGSRLVLAAIALLLLIDGGMILAAVGGFFGGLMLVGTGALFAASALFAAPQSEPSEQR